METLIDIINWICFTGLNKHLAALVHNSSLIAIPILIVFWKWIQYKASQSEAPWDDQAVDAIGEYFDIVEDDEEDDEDEEGSTPLGFIPRPKSHPKKFKLKRKIDK